MTYICEYCGAVLDDNEIQSVREWLTEDHWDTIGICPHCKHDEFLEAAYCDKCNEWKPEREMVDGFCEECQELILKDYRHDPVKVYNVSAEDEAEVKISGFLARMFTATQIEALLLNELSKVDADCSEYIEDDRDWFLAKVKEKGGVK